MTAGLEFFGSDSSHVGFEDFAVNIANVDADLAGLYGMTAGMYIAFTREKHGPDGEFQDLAVSPISLTSDDDVVLRLVFDEADYQFQASFSVDDGATFQDPGLAWDIVSLGPIADSLGASEVFESWNLQAMNIVVPEPSTALLVGIGLLLMTTMRQQPGVETR
jgi:hypothetical protein